MLEIRALICAGVPPQFQKSDFSGRERKIESIELSASAFAIQTADSFHLVRNAG